ncbi:DUF6361 family protein [Ornithinimicrobium pratense]|uniref:Uncharacterized protein n=1 Tax=Ornithinimicrobium pratense TaxID=2593973 RepID=A0A5J6V7F0_9MICO|nr:DUF6361 family protein [Ornithinimicrobium pratense]QFG69244.1 hypothetical protein FY030_11480 [Ornithinimicrobium pratense]
MASVLAWVDYSSAHRDQMDRLLDAFRDKGTVDELGIGTLRDTFSDHLFPGTSTLHTRARYLLFVPWAVTSTTPHRWPADRAERELRRLEGKLIEALRSGDLDGGVIGRDAGATVQRLPSTVYWSALGAYDIRRCGHSIAQHLRFSTERPPPSVDEDEDILHVRHRDPCFRQLPVPPDDWLQTANFTLSRAEAEFLRDRILDTCSERYLGWLVQRDLPGNPERPWDPALTADLPAEISGVLAHARRFSRLHEGAPILYNLLLARLKDWEEGVERYTAQLEAWADDDETHQAVATWDEDDFWSCVARAGWRHNVRTQSFVRSWVDLVHHGADLVHGQAAEQLIRERETNLKGRRSRFVNPDALEAWEGGNGMGRMTFRWSEARQLVTDIRQGLEASNA